MKIAVLTTETPHHAFFVRGFAQTYGNVHAVCEMAPAGKAPFETHHAFEDARDAYEWARWFSRRATKINEFVPTQKVASMNDVGALDAIRGIGADVAIVFGTRVLKQAVIDACPPMTFNLHGGDPEEYRGLDTHLWAIFHQDFAALIATLHRLDAGIDTGDIVVQAAVPLARNMPLHALRAANTELCIDLATAAIDMVSRTGRTCLRPQRRMGRYYSAMPSALKSVCKTRFEKYTAGIAG